MDRGDNRGRITACEWRGAPRRRSRSRCRHRGGWAQRPDWPGQQLQALAGELAVDSGDDDVAVLRPVETFHDQQVAVENTGVLHRQPLRAHQVGALRVTDADVVQRQALLEGVTDFQRRLAGVGLGDEEFTDIDAQLLRVTRIERVLFL